VVAFWAGLALAALPLVLAVKLETNASSLLSTGDAQWGFYQESMEQFGGDEVIVVALEGPEEYDAETLRLVGELSARLEGHPGVRRVDSLSTTPIVSVRDDGSVDFSPAVSRGAIESPEGRARIRDAAESDRIAPRSLVSDDGSVLAVNVLLDRAWDDQASVVEEIEAALVGRNAWVSGVPIFETEVGPETQREVLLFVPVTLLSMLAILGLLFRSLFVILIPLVSSAVGSLLVLAAMGLLQEPLTIVGILLPSILLALGCAYVMHVLTAFGDCVDDESRVRALSRVGGPIALSGLTTMLGFLAMAIVRIDAIRGIGLFGALGVFIVTVASLTLAPAMICLRPGSISSSRLSAWLRNFGGGWWVEALMVRRKGIIGGWLILCVVASFGLSALTIETDGTKWWSKGSKVRDDYEAIRERLSGISPMNVVIDGKGQRRVSEPEVIEKIRQLSAYLSGFAEVGKVISVADPIQQIHEGFVGAVGGRLPGSRGEIEQYLLLLESVDHIGDLISDDRRSANILLRLDNNGSHYLLELAAAAEAWWKEFGPSDFDVQTTGIMFEFARSEDAIAKGQLAGLSLALGAVFVVLFALFRSPMVVLVGLIPNVVPLLVAFGSLGLLGLSLDAGTACLGSLAIGIAVDDTIHVMVRWREEWTRRESVIEVLSETFREVLPALVFSTVLIAVGFGVIAFSEFSLTRNLGWVTALIVVLCLVADITLLPALLSVRRSESQEDAGSLVSG
jgi:hypothetical protein